VIPQIPVADPGVTREYNLKWLRWFVSHPRLTIVLVLGATAGSYYLTTCSGLALDDRRLRLLRIPMEVLASLGVFSVFNERVEGRSTWFKLGCFCAAVALLQVWRGAVHAMLLAAVCAP